jgi:hypothetical protein
MVVTVVLSSSKGVRDEETRAVGLAWSHQYRNRESQSEDANSRFRSEAGDPHGSMAQGCRER